MKMFDNVSQKLINSKKIVFVTGAGISQESGIPTFRGKDGHWRKHDPMKLATIDAFFDDPSLVWEWYEDRRKNILSAKPNEGHFAIANMEKFRDVVVLTQNIDGLHQAAGNTPGKVIEIHGTIHYVVCMSCKKRTRMKDELTRVSSGESDPSCLECNGILKSDTISFGQSLDETKIAMAFDYVKNSDLLLCVGTTLQVFPIAGAVDVAKAASAQLIIVNNQATQYDDVADGVLRDSINEVIPLILGT